FAIGTTQVNCDSQDAKGNNAVQTHFNVIVQDTTAPVVDTHGDVTAESADGSAIPVTFTPPTSHDAVDGDLPSVCSPDSGSTFPLGSTKVTCGKTDSHSNAADPAIFHVIVQDTTNPTVHITSPLSTDTTGTTTTAIYTVSDGTVTCKLDSN